jgi:hypothetical protein
MPTHSKALLEQMAPHNYIFVQRVEASTQASLHLATMSCLLCHKHYTQSQCSDQCSDQ